MSGLGCRRINITIMAALSLTRWFDGDAVVEAARGFAARGGVVYEAGEGARGVVFAVGFSFVRFGGLVGFGDGEGVGEGGGGEVVGGEG